MNKYTLEEIRQTQKGKGFWLKLSNEIASRLIYKIQNIDIHPNWFTFVSLVFGVLFGVALLNKHLILALLFINLLYLFDNFDGQWARVKKMTSSFGAMFDSLVDGWNISIVVFSMGIYLYNQEENVLYLYLTTFFFILSFLDFALEKNNLLENADSSNYSETLSLQKRSSKFKPLILFIDSFIMYDKWILIITLGLLFDMLYLSLFYIIFVRFLSYSVKLFKLYLKFK